MRNAFVLASSSPTFIRIVQWIEIDWRFRDDDAPRARSRRYVDIIRFGVRYVYEGVPINIRQATILFYRLLLRLISTRFTALVVLYDFITRALHYFFASNRITKTAVTVAFVSSSDCSTCASRTNWPARNVRRYE